MSQNWCASFFVALAGCSSGFQSAELAAIPTGGGSSSSTTPPAAAASSGAAPTASTAIVSSATVPAGAVMTFDDEFSDLSISDTNGGNVRWYAQRIQCCMYDTSNPSTPTAMAGFTAPAGENPFSLVAGGGLDIRLQKTNGEWYSGVIATADDNGNGFSQQYGYFEIRAKFPTGEGTWPSFWMVSTNPTAAGRDPGEIDIFETYSILNNAPALVSTMHNWSSTYLSAHNGNSTCNPEGGPSVVDEPDMYQGYHTYGFLWTAQTMTYYYDAKQIYSMPTQAVFQQPYFMIVDLGIGGGWPTTTIMAQNDMLVQYVRAYALPK